MLAYVYTHRPAATADPAHHLERLRAFHGALANDPPTGFVRSWVWRVGDGPLGEALEDWYLVADWAALGNLNEAAVSGPRAAPHDAVAGVAGEGMGALYRLIHGAPDLESTIRVRLVKPSGMTYANLEAELARVAAPVAIWKRQMVLGGDAEFLIDTRDSGLTFAGTRNSVSPLVAEYPRPGSLSRRASGADATPRA